MTGMNKVALAIVAILYIGYVILVFSCGDRINPTANGNGSGDFCDDIGGEFVPDVGNPEAGMCVLE